MNFRRLAINGRFLTSGPTGVRRVAKELLSQLANHRSELADVFDELPRLICATRSSQWGDRPSLK